MSTTWILVAERSSARLFAQRKLGGELVLVREIAHPDGRRESHELVTDRPGRTHEPQGSNNVVSTFEPRHTAAENAADAFAASLADTVNRGRNDHAYERLILVAEPRFLGLLRGALSHATAATVSGSLDKDLSVATADELRHKIVHLLPVV
jgi:protein required for attachment to host cells